jgi:hypothetical protein
MPIEFWTSVDRDLVVCKWWGPISLSDFRVTFAKYLSDANYRPGRPELIDFTGVTSADVGFKSIWSALTTVNNQVPGKKVRTRTILIAPGDLVYGLSRMYQTLSQNTDGIRVEVYRTQRERHSPHSTFHSKPSTHSSMPAGSALTRRPKRIQDVS